MVYTRTGDTGQTSLLNGKAPLLKDSLRIETCSTIDELNSHIGMLRDLLDGHNAEQLTDIQKCDCSISGSTLAAGDEATVEKFKVPMIHEADVEALEKTMDAFDADLPTMRNFILPGGHPAISQAHICRTRSGDGRAHGIRLAVDEAVPAITIRYLNRLSDLLFMLARWTGHPAERTGNAMRGPGLKVRMPLTSKAFKHLMARSSASGRMVSLSNYICNQFKKTV
ncbi:MAG: cob(I)yrinic acid a,c-diamide adenosyltransferase [Flavobacteriales bacterium]|nr:cob(I)yrinic acid a,c-diamide adenosyltransferase [Flavobacteriales bacterium]